MAEIKSSKKSRKQKKQKLMSEQNDSKSEEQESATEAEVSTTHQQSHNSLPESQKKSDAKNMRSMKKRLEADCDYISNVMSFVIVPAEAQQKSKEELKIYEDLDDVDDVDGSKAELVTGKNRAKNYQELKEKFDKKMAEIRAKQGQPKPENLKRKADKKTEEGGRKKEEERQTETKSYKNSRLEQGKHEDGN